jgi:hypothetical protein
MPPNGWRFTCRAPRRGDGEATDLDADGTTTVRRRGDRSGASACWAGRRRDAALPVELKALRFDEAPTAWTVRRPRGRTEAAPRARSRFSAASRTATRSRGPSAPPANASRSPPDFHGEDSARFGVEREFSVRGSAALVPCIARSGRKPERCALATNAPRHSPETMAKTSASPGIAAAQRMAVHLPGTAPRRR